MNRKNIINQEKQLSEFYSTLDYKPLSANAISIYLVLLEIARKTEWRSEFKVTNTILKSKIKGLNISSLQRARNELINNGTKRGIKLFAFFINPPFSKSAPLAF